MASGAVINVTTVGDYDPTGGANNAVDSNAPGSNVATFTSNVATAFTNGTGGVINFDGSGTLAQNDILRASFAGGAKTVDFVNINDAEAIGQNFSTTRTATSGSANSHLSASGATGPSDRMDFKFTVNNLVGGAINERVTRVGVTVLSRSGLVTGTTGQVDFIATLDNASTISTGVDTINNSNATDDTFYELTAPAGRYITEIWVDLNSNNSNQFFSAIDDLAFMTSIVPEPASLGGLALLCGGLMRRRR